MNKENRWKQLQNDFNKIHNDMGKQEYDTHLRAHESILVMSDSLTLSAILEELTNIRKILAKANKPKRKQK
jgi:hypothetical protein